MLKKLVPFSKVPQLAKTDLAYATGDDQLTPFYKYDLKQDVFHDIIQDKAQNNIPRSTLADVLQQQYRNFPNKELALESIELLCDSSTYTVCTAHQPCLFLGPLYVVYKAITTINLAEAAQGIVGPHKKIIPIFVLGSEDHDIEEVNHVHLFGKTVTWNPGIKGPVGRISTETMKDVLKEMDSILGPTEYARQLSALFTKVYTEYPTFASATQALLHELFGSLGLLVIDMDQPELKRCFLPIMEQELKEQKAFELVSNTAGQLQDLGYKVQAAPREINLFYFTGEGRERIVKEGSLFKVLHTDLVFSESEIIAHLHQYPERFSPNVVLRPLYQETILPNLAYVGGGGELAYWLERKSLFEHYGLNYPLLVRRNSVLWIDRDASKKLERFGFTVEQFFSDTESLLKLYVEENASADVDLGPEVRQVERLVTKLAEKAAAIDPTLEKAALADGVKMKDMVAHWQSKLLRAEKQKHEISLNQIRTLKEKLFPSNGLQERHDCFIPSYLRYSDRFFGMLKDRLLPLEHGFIVLEDAQAH